MSQNNWASRQASAAQAAARRSQQQSQQQQQRHRMLNQQQQLQWLQQLRQQRIAAQRAGQPSAGSSGAPPQSRPYRPRPRWRRLLLAVIVIALLGAGVAALAANSADRLPPGLGGVLNGGPGAVTATPTVALNVRAAPSSHSPILDTVRPGETLRLACQTGGWDRLAAPHAGAYVYDRYLSRSQPLDECS